MDHARFMGRDIEVEFTRGYRKTPAEMRLKERRDDGRGGNPGRRHRSRSRSRTRSRSPSKKGRDQYGRRSSDRRDDSRRRNSNARVGSHSRSPTRSRSPSHEEIDNGVDSRKDSRRNDRRDGRASSRSPPPRRRGSGSRSRSGSY
ncbi:FUS-interacting serine-arginine-rich protein 1 [Fasciolopsis buskii]|uniref:FUS-interacting serine-arginine-rich protein 1 n=1 Tax=Fasciolopsis buskii TaxID=27845 RepID=A0A8E0RPS7_9TREM|nr:FUS-interacting serine-arginine-rich protein 1 [Fasciolopsis buski]